MRDLNKINSLHLYTLWKNLSICLLIFIVLISCTRLLPFYLAPVLGLGGAALAYTLLFKGNGKYNCNILLYCTFYCLIIYCVVSITINVLYAWGYIVVPREIIFFNSPYICSLVLMPVSFLTMLYMTVFRKSLFICRECRRLNGDRLERGLHGIVLDRETKIQLWNLTVLFGVLSVVEWYYFLFHYSDVNQNGRDWYVFVWLILIAFLLDEIYFIYRFVNLYLDLKEADELLSPDDIQNMETKTYLRFHVICDEKLFLNPHSIDPSVPYREVFDTPFQTRRSINGISLPEVKMTIERATGVDNGELKFFYGRKFVDNPKNTMLRYFYFLDGKPEDYPKLVVEGEWMDFHELQKLYQNNPGNLSTMLLADMTRLATIILTEKKYNPDGSRRHVLKSYQPVMTISDIRKSHIDFQDDHWIRIAGFNADTSFYHLKKLWRHIIGHEA